MGQRESKERRKEKRIQFSGSVLLDGKCLYKGIDISHDGLYVFTGTTVEEKKIIVVTLPIQGCPLTLSARVEHSQPGIGMGLKFIDLNEDQKKILKEILQGIKKKSEKSFHERSKVLLVEGDDVSRKENKNMLFAEGFSVMETKDGMEGLQFLKEQIPDIIILDLCMEKISALKVLTILKSSPNWKNIPVVVFSARDTQEVREDIIEAGADEYLSKKQLSPNKLLKTVKKLLA